MGLIVYLWDESNYLSYYVSGLPFDAMLTETNYQNWRHPKTGGMNVSKLILWAFRPMNYSIFGESIGIFTIECSIFGSIGVKIHLSLFEKRLLPKCCLMIRVSGSETSLHKLLCKNFYGGWFETHVHGVRTLHT